jgi:hypothetical protein
MLRKDSMDLTSSRVLLSDGEPCGIALLARRGWTSRLAAMGIFPYMRGKKSGAWFMSQLIEEARARNDRVMVLEVIEQNEPAVRLYKSAGFTTVRRLIGLICNDSAAGEREELHEIDLREMGRLVLQNGLPDLPWQLSGETIALLTPPARAFQKGNTAIAVSNPEAEHVVVWSLLGAGDEEAAVKLLRTVMSNYEGKHWHVPAILPEELGVLFERAGFQREDLSQWQMRLQL